jgi:hypothetical protein
MTTLSIQPTFPIFTDIDGQPLEDGYVFIGTANLNPITNPITVYWDAALTLAAAQPIRTLGGYPMNSGTPARLYVNSDYSIQVQNKNGSLIYSAPAATERYGNIISSADVTFLQAGTGAVTRTAQAKMRDVVSVKDFGAVGNGITDDTTAVHAAFNAAKAQRASVYFPAGTYRVTSGYTNSTNYTDLYMFGDGQTREGVGSGLGSCVLLDNASASSFFYKITGRSALTVDNMTFKCNQFAQDREFFVFDSGFHAEFFTNVNFESVEKPFVFKINSYFQNSAFTNVQFRSSGTFHSEAGGTQNLRGTLMALNNVNHESGVPVNTAKIVCDLSAIRQIYAYNFLLEGALPGTGWTILKLTNPYDDFYTRATFAIFENYHSEWAGPAPTYAVDQIGGNVQWNYFVGVGPAFPYKLSSLGSVDISNVAFSGSTDDPATYFSLENSQCVVRLTNCAARRFDPLNTSIHYRMVQVADINDGQGQVVIDSTDSSCVYSWSGGYVLADNVSSNFVAAGQSMYPATDATYGRKLVAVPDGSGILNPNIIIPAQIKAGMQVTIMARMKLPTFASGLWAALNCDIGTQNAIAYQDTGSSGAVVDVQVTRVALADLSNITISFTNGTTPGATGGTTVEVYALAIFVGAQIPRRLFARYPKRITTSNSAVPTTGTWAVGDRVFNSAPAVGQPKSWVCTVAGTPGTWVSEGNL